MITTITITKVLLGNTEKEGFVGLADGNYHFLIKLKLFTYK